MKASICVFFGLFIVKGSAVGVEFKGIREAPRSQVYRLRPVNKNQTDILYGIQTAQWSSWNFWTDTNSIGNPIDIMDTPYNKIDSFLKEYEIDFEVLIDDPQELINEEIIGHLNESKEMTWDKYYTLEDIYDWMEHLRKKYPEIVTIISAGDSRNLIDIKGMKISFKSGKRNVFIEGGIHGREWISPATVTHMINELLTNDNDTFRSIAESFDWYIFPIVNPDGYIVSYEQERMWKKTFSRYYYFCFGVDLNKNFDYDWREGSNFETCSDGYHGPHPFSEPEALAISKLFSSIGPNTDVYLSFHSYSQQLLFPYLNNGEKWDNYDNLNAIGLKMVESLAQRYDTQYKVRKNYDAIYPVTGGSIDWAKNTYKIPITFTYELRDEGDYGFLLPAEEIIPNCEEVMDSIITMFLESEKLQYFQLDRNTTSFIKQLKQN